MRLLSLATRPVNSSCALSEPAHPLGRGGAAGHSPGGKIAPPSSLPVAAKTGHSCEETTGTTPKDACSSRVPSKENDRKPSDNFKSPGAEEHEGHAQQQPDKSGPSEPSEKARLPDDTPEDILARKNELGRYALHNHLCCCQSAATASAATAASTVASSTAAVTAAAAAAHFCPLTHDLASPSGGTSLPVSKSLSLLANSFVEQGVHHFFPWAQGSSAAAFNSSTLLDAASVVFSNRPSCGLNSRQLAVNVFAALLVERVAVLLGSVGHITQKILLQAGVCTLQRRCMYTT
eukprot:GHVT01090070.1.p1 GENE.GHVT01090070.1~~GHVT01090070.1.p1  ORF type:complete len:291 (-),score=50.23 GHVT01090070.1:2007-2879(-)